MRGTIAALLVLTAAAAAAAEDTAKSSLGARLNHNAFGVPAGVPAPPDSAPPLTREQLRACFQDRQAATNRLANAGAAPADDAATQAALRKRQAELRARKDALPAAPDARAPRDAIMAYNARVTALQADYDALNRDIKARNAVVGGINGAVGKFNADCAGRTFSTEDFKAVQKEFPDVTF